MKVEFQGVNLKKIQNTNEIIIESHGEPEVVELNVIPRIGDWVEADNTSGIVCEVHWLIAKDTVRMAVLDDEIDYLDFMKSKSLI